MQYNTKESIESALNEARNSATKAARLVELYNSFGFEQVKRFVPKSKGNERCTEILEGMLAKFSNKISDKTHPLGAKETKSKKVGVRVSFDGSDFVGVSGTKIKLWKDAKAIRLTGQFSADQEKYYNTRFTDKITYVTSEDI